MTDPRRISSRFTWLHKYATPLCFFLSLGMLAWILFRMHSPRPIPSLYVALMVLALIGFGEAYRRWVWTLMDEVVDHGRFLEVRFHSVRERIFFGNIRDVTLTRVNPPLMVLHLKERCLLGTEIRFVPPIPLLSFLPVPLLDELKARLRRPKSP